MPLFDEVDVAVQVVSEDLADGFRGIFAGPPRVTPVGLFAEEPVGTVSESLSVVAWEWPVVHIGALQGTPATLRELTLRGVTIVENEETVVDRGEPIFPGGGGPRVFSRYIDWLALYAELGAVTITRPPVDDRSLLPAEDNLPHPVEPDDPDA